MIKLLKFIHKRFRPKVLQENHPCGPGSVSSLRVTFFIKTASENPVLWTGMKGASAESRKNKSDAETSSA
jgi:hypothetical protein